MKHRSFLKLLTVMIVVLLVAFTAGCGNKTQTDPGTEPVNSNPEPETVTAAVYFSDSNAQYLVPVEVEIEKGEDSLEKKIIETLIKGPEKEGLAPVLPPETKIRSVIKEGDIVYVDFSEEIKTKHWGGSTGETFTIYGVVNSLTELPDVNQVQLLIEGNKEDSIAGHYTLEEPFERDESMIKE